MNGETVMTVSIDLKGFVLGWWLMSTRNARVESHVIAAASGVIVLLEV